MTTKNTHKSDKHDQDEKPTPKHAEKKVEKEPESELIHLMHQRIESEADGKK